MNFMDPNVSLQLAKRTDETIWGRAITNLGRVFYSSNFSIYSLLISRKRKSVIKAYGNYARISAESDINKRELIKKI